MQTEVGAVTSHIYIFEKSISEAYAIIYNDYPKDSLTEDNADEFLNDMARHLAKKMQANLINEENIWINDYPGRDIKLKLPNGFIYWIRLCTVENRFYQIQAVIANNAYSENAKKFLDSFELLKN